MEQPLRTFESCYEEISQIVEKWRVQWTFKASVMQDFDDIKSEILTHIWKKWPKYDQSRPLGGWVATIAKRQFWNILRDIYLSTSSPCARCVCNTGNGQCTIYGEQGEEQKKHGAIECPLYKKWDKTKKYSHQARLPVTIEDKEFQVYSLPDSNVDLLNAANGLHEKMKEVLTKSEWDIYERIYVLHQDEAKVAEELGFKKTEEKRKTMADRRIRQLKTLAVKKAKQILKEHGIEGL